MIAFIASPTGGPRTAGEQRAAAGTRHSNRPPRPPATAEPPDSQPRCGGGRGQPTAPNRGQLGR